MDGEVPSDVLVQQAGENGRRVEIWEADWYKASLAMELGRSERTDVQLSIEASLLTIAAVRRLPMIAESGDFRQKTAE
jgi:hypothetical protein